MTSMRSLAMRTAWEACRHHHGGDVSQVLRFRPAAGDAEASNINIFQALARERRVPQRSPPARPTTRP